jgi:hypothetical protein
VNYTIDCHCFVASFELLVHGRANTTQRIRVLKINGRNIYRVNETFLWILILTQADWNYTSVALAIGMRGVLVRSGSCVACVATADNKRRKSTGAFGVAVQATVQSETYELNVRADFH